MPRPSGNQIARPNENTYWVVPNRFLAGEYPFDRHFTKGRVKLASYLQAGIDFFIDLTERYELEPYAPDLPAGVEYRRMAVRDHSVPSARQMKAILDTLDDALDAGRRVYLHCWGGVGRTGTVVGCWLQRYDRTPEEALAEIARHWRTVQKRSRLPRSPETREQEAWVLAWPRHLAGLDALEKEK